MPAFIKTAKDEAAWAEAKAAVRKQYPDLSEDDDRFWRLVNAIYQKMAGKVAKALSATQQADFDRETQAIREHAKTAVAKRRHKFQRAKWTHPNGHPRCRICGDEQPVGGYCEPEPQPVKKAVWGFRVNRAALTPQRLWGWTLRKSAARKERFPQEIVEASQEARERG
ncbi:MAG: hypothetical protein UY48_C0002G0035 [Candidatus Gottesmanbacteria bacterium GW2011_GWB1_49_7]|uniref:Uncharacterized protein n=1 Tax=Candidatus Gottesmanbacteria bacterium GW2011_GWB1_49_7 TaxID=1618448 RepID=A0A0G1Z3H5_9BACT|nr:MAG: hypothetical protein UY48_C0002G0035 [Candidatus Gottesmanbacteria bacterium GW2011_GWB1_49_7]